MKAISHLTSILVLVLLSGCTIVDGSTIVTGVARKPISIDQVRIYRTAPKKYEEIAMVSSSAGHDFKSNSSLVETAILRLKQEAAKVGANGVLLSGFKERDAATTSSNFGNVQAYGNDGSSAFATGSSVSINRGDAYTRVRGLAIFVNK